mgnify:CR=1 FL=1
MRRGQHLLRKLARRSPDVNQRSGVSVRASVANYEALLANALRRAIRLGETDVVPRISDLAFVMPSLAGKVELDDFQGLVDRESDGRARFHLSLPERRPFF